MTCYASGQDRLIGYPPMYRTDVKIMLTHKLNPICDNCSNDVSRDRSNRGLTRGANLIQIDLETQKLNLKTLIRLLRFKTDLKHSNLPKTD